MIIESNKQGQLNSVVDVRYEQEFNPKADSAEFTLADRSEALDIQKNERIEVKDGSIVEFVGYVRKRNKEDGGNYTVRCKGQYNNLQGVNVNGRVFVEEDKGDVINSLLTKQVKRQTTTIENNCSSLTDFNFGSNIPNSELANLIEYPVHETGSDGVYIDWPKNSVRNKGTQNYSLTVDNISYDGTEPTELILNMVTNPNGQFFNFEFIYYDDKQDKAYKWIRQRHEWETEYRLRLDRASYVDPSNTSLTQGQLKINIKVEGNTISGKAIVLDAIKTKSNILENRNLLDTVNTIQTGHDITRKFKSSVDDAIYNLTKNSSYRLLINNDTADLVKRGSNDSGFKIKYNDVRIVNADIRENIDRIRNSVVLEGSDGIRVRADDQQSQIDNATKETNSKEEISTAYLRDESITNINDAQEETSKYLKENSRDDEEWTFTYVDVSVKDKVKLGDEVGVEWRTLDRVETMTVEKIVVTENTVKITVRP